MSRSWSMLLLALLLMAGLATVPSGTAAHEWGHRFMVSGRILDAEGNPAQLVMVTIAVESTMPFDPQISVFTDCTGFYHSLKQREEAMDYNLDSAGGGGFRIHIHDITGGRDYDARARYIVATPYAEYRGEGALTPSRPLDRDQLLEYAIHTERADRDLQSATANIRLDDTLTPDPECEDTPDWRSDHIVVGKAQHVTRTGRKEAVMANQEVNVTIETTDGERSMTVSTDVTATYIARFRNVTVVEGSEVVARFGGKSYDSRADTEFGVTRVNLIERDPLIGTGTWIFLGILAAAAVAVAAAFGVRRLKERMEVQKARETSTRKRARR